MKLSELIAAIGDDNVFVQNLADNVVNATATKSRGDKVTFMAPTGKGVALATCALTGHKPEWVGLVLWISRDKIPEDMK